MLENAVKYTESGDSIELRARAVDEIIVIEVADSGPGVFRWTTVVDAIARAHGGSCALQPSAVGSTFALTLPGYRPAGVVAAEA